MQVTENTNLYNDYMGPGSFIGSTMVASGIKNSLIIYHGYLGCNIEAIHMRSDMIPGGSYTPIIATGLNESDSVYGGTQKLQKTLDDTLSSKYDIVWIITGDATSITADDIHGIAAKYENRYNTTIIALDVPGFLGGIAVGTDIAIHSLVKRNTTEQVATGEIALIAPHMMGIKSHPTDTMELESLLTRSTIDFNNTLAKNMNFNSFIDKPLPEFFYPLTWESLSNTEQYCHNNRISFISHEDLLPIGIANSEKWLLTMAKRFNKEDNAKKILLEDRDIVLKQLKYNYNYSWLAGLFNEKTCSIYGGAQFAASLAYCLYEDFNIRPKVIAIIAETESAKAKTISALAELSETLDFELLINPDYYTYIKHIKEANVDFAIGAVQDKPLCVGEGIPHLSLAGYYFFNNFNFTPWPYMGVRGCLSLLTELGFLMEKAFYYQGHWQEYKFKIT